MKRNVALAALILAAVCAATAAGAALAPPSATARPSISGSARDGSTLTTSNGRWTNNPKSYAYEWLRCGAAGANCVQISGANSKTYTLTSTDVGHRIRSEVIATNSSGSTSSTSDPTNVVISNGTAPHNTALPTISGTTQEGQTLSAGPGGWSGAQPISFTYQWNRCDGSGAGCAAIPGATGQTYNTASADVTHTLRVTVKASNRLGSSSATSGQTALIGPARAGGAAVSVTTISLPDRLVVDNVKFSGSNPIVGRFHVSDLHGLSVQGALVYALGLPYNWATQSGEVATDANGWATVTFHPTASMPHRRGTALVIFVRARKPGENLLAGVSTRRLVQASIR